MMDQKRKILVVVGSVAVLATASVGGLTLFLLKDPVARSNSGQTVSFDWASTEGRSSNNSEPAPNGNDNPNENENKPDDPSNNSDSEQSEDKSNEPVPAPTPTPTPTPVPAPTTPTPSLPPAPRYLFRNGTYTATASYAVPGNDVNTITTTITISNDTVTSVRNSNTAKDKKSWSYIDSFEGSIGGVVIGKPMATLKPSRVGGASLTTNGFNDALNAIRSRARF